MKQVNINDIDTLINTLNNFPNNYIFRGHGKSTWNLTSTLERTLSNNYKAKADKTEKYSLDTFQCSFK